MNSFMGLVPYFKLLNRGLKKVNLTQVVGRYDESDVNLTTRVYLRGFSLGKTSGFVTTVMYFRAIGYKVEQKDSRVCRV